MHLGQSSGRLWRLIPAIGVLILHGCGRNDAEPAPGSDGGACFGNRTCLVGLACSGADICVDPNTLARCDHPVVLWSAGFEPGDPIPAIIGNDGSTVETSSAHGGNWIATVADGDVFIETPFTIRVPGRNLVLTYWLTNGSGTTDDGAIVDLTSDGGDTWQLSNSPEVDLTDARTGWSEFVGPFDLPQEGLEVRVRLTVSKQSGFADIDDLELSVTDPTVPCP